MIESTKVIAKVLTTESARNAYPDFFTTVQGQEYFTRVHAHGNLEHVDYWPELLLCVEHGDKLVVLENASEWHMQDVGLLGIED